MENLSPFEIKVMNLAIRRNVPWQEVMRSQIPLLKVKRRDLNGSGFITYFDSSGVSNLNAVPEGVAPLRVGGCPDYPPTVNAVRTMPTEGLASFIVWLDLGGKIDRLEAVSLTDDQWPDDPFEGFTAFQDDSGNIIEM